MSECSRSLMMKKFKVLDNILGITWNSLILCMFYMIVSLLFAIAKWSVNKRIL